MMFDCTGYQRKSRKREKKNSQVYPMMGAWPPLWRRSYVEDLRCTKLIDRFRFPLTGAIVFYLDRESPCPRS